MAGASSPVDISALFNTAATTVASIYKGESEAELARARIKADAARDAAAIQAGYGFAQRPLSTPIDLSGLVGSVVPLLGLAIVGGLVMKAFKR